MASQDEMQKVHHAVLRQFIDAGRAPHYTELADKFGLSPAKARQILRETVEGSPYSIAWLTPDTDFVSSWAPFSNLGNHNPITIQNQQKWFPQ
jgi:hypothetical protein